MAVTKPLSRAARQGFLFPYDSWAHRVAVWRFVRDIPLSSSHSSMALLKDIGDKLKHFQKHPVTACWGGKDFCFNRQYLRKWNNIFPKMNTHLYPEAGHYILEDAGEEAIQAIGNALRKVET